MNATRPELTDHIPQYPTFRLVNKKTRIYLSEPFILDRLITYRPFAVANTKGWFAAIRKTGDTQGGSDLVERQHMLMLF